MRHWIVFTLLAIASSIARADAGIFDDGFDALHQRECHGMTQQVRNNLAIAVQPAIGGSDLRMRASIKLPAIKGDTIEGALIAEGGTAPYVFSEVTSNLTTIGITLNADGTFSGTYSAVAHVAFVAQVQDAALATFTCTFSINVLPAMEVVAGTPPPGEVNASSYAYQLSVRNNVGAVTFALTSGAWPFLYTMSSAGLITGSPFASATTSPLAIVVTATDAGTGDTLEIPFTFEVKGHLSAGTFTISYPVGVPIEDALIPARIQMIGGVPPVAFANIVVPSWMTYELHAFVKDPTIPITTGSPYDQIYAEIVFFGTPPAATYTNATQNVTITFDALDAYGATVSASVAMTITNTALGKSQNLSDVANAATARANLGLATGATTNVFYGSASGTNTYAATMSPGPSLSYTDGDLYIVAFVNANTGASTLNVNGVGAISIINHGTACVGGEIPAGARMLLRYTSTGPQFDLIGGAGGGSSSTIDKRLLLGELYG